MLNKNFSKDVEKPSYANIYKEGILDKPKFQLNPLKQREGAESGEPKNYEDMDLDELLRDPVARPIVEQKALEYLQSEDAEYFNREFSGELDEEGYLYKKDGTTSNTKPSQNIGGGLAMERVMEMVRAELRKIKPA